MTYETIENEHSIPYKTYNDNANRFSAFVSDDEDDIKTVHDDYDEMDKQNTESETSNSHDNMECDDDIILPTSDNIKVTTNQKNKTGNVHDNDNSQVYHENILDDIETIYDDVVNLDK